MCTVLAPDGRGNRLVFYGDKTPLASFEPWYIHYTSEVFPTEVIEPPRIMESGPARACVRYAVRPGTGTPDRGTRIEQDITLYAGLPYAEFRTRGEWHEANVLLKAELDFSFTCSAVAAEMPYGLEERPPNRAEAVHAVQRDTAIEDGLEAGREIPEPDLPMGRWLDFADTGYGVAVLNNGRYGYDAGPSGVRLSLMRSPRHRDGQLLGLGSFSFAYALMPHAGDWRQASLPFWGWSHNHPLIAWRGDPRRAGLDAAGPVLSVGSPNVVMSAIKQAEDGGGFVLRLFESHGVRTRAVVRTVFDCEGVEECSLIEEPLPTAPALRVLSPHEIELDMGPFEIRSIRIFPPPRIHGQERRG